MSKATRKETRGFAMVLGYLGLFMILIGIITTIPLFMCFYPGENEKRRSSFATKIRSCYFLFGF